MTALPWSTTAGGAPTVALGNSLGTVQASWAPLIDALAGTRATLTFDLPGHHPERLEPFDFERMVSDTVDTLREHDHGPVVFCGVSLGGALAVRVAADHPELVRAVVAVNAPVMQPDPAFWHARARAVEQNGLEQFALSLHERWFSADAEPAIVEALRADFRALPAVGYAHACRAIADLDIRSAASRVRVPTVIVHATEDVAVAASNSEELAALIPGARLIRHRGAHLLPVENPSAVREAIELAIAQSEEMSR